MIENAAAVEAGLRAMSWKKRVKSLIASVKEHHEAVELPPWTRLWMTIDRSTGYYGAPTPERNAQLVELQKGSEDEQGWLGARTETMPVSGWVVTAAHFLIDGKRHWLWAAKRHSDAAPLVGQCVPAPADKRDLNKLARIISFAGGNPELELFRTGAITLKEHEDFIAEGKVDVANYGSIFFMWKA
jgi:hypothetical protein